MAIDTAEKRRSAGGVAFLPLGPGVTPNSSKDNEWRYQSGWSYSGILVAVVLGSSLFIATQGARGDEYSQSGTGDTFSQSSSGDIYAHAGSGDTFSQSGNDDDFTQGGGIA